MNPTDTDIRFLIKQVIAENKTLLEKKKITTEEVYQSFVPGLLPEIFVDKQLCLIIFRALIANAIFYSHDESVVTISVDEVDQGNEFGSKILKEKSLVFSIKDNGIGIKESEQKNIFTRFFKGSNIVDDETKGAGLSLNIVHAIVGKVGGDIWFVSKEGEGSVFYVAFPETGMTRKEGRTTLD